ncbi:MAG TPA: RHS repeat-associated core domain-containing protein [Anaerolineales bacterium]|jgi:RHS repeat-associated protein
MSLNLFVERSKLGGAGKTKDIRSLVIEFESLDRSMNWKLNGVTKVSYIYDPATGKLASKAGVALTYGDANHKQAVTGMGANSYSYDANGSQVTRNINGQTFTLGYDAENRMVSVTGPSMNASFVYDGNGKRVKSVINGVGTVFVGNYYEVVGGAVTKYYFLGSQRVALRQGGALYYPLTDHLGSTSVTTDSLGNAVAELRYTAWGEVRYASGTTLSKYQFTGQYNEGELGLYYYNARWYDGSLGRFVQADSIVPPGAQGLDRYAAMANNPVRYTDPSGHMADEGDGGGCTNKIDCSGFTKFDFNKTIKNITPGGWKRSITISAGWGSNLNANGKKVPTVLFYGLSLVSDKDGGVQLYSETLDIEFAPTLELNPAEQALPSELFGAGVSATQGPIWKTDRTSFLTSNYEGEARSSGGGWGIITAEYYESFPKPNVKGVDIGISFGSPSVWSISTYAKPIFNIPRIDFTFWNP